MSETNERGNRIERRFFPNRERYHYDFGECQPKNGWTQYDTDQDAWYFGMWVHSERRETLTYAEGDETRVYCPTVESFKAELANAAEFYGDPPPMAIGIDHDGAVTKFYDERPTE